MKIAWRFLVGSAFFTGVFLFLTGARFGRSTVDVHVIDTYYILSYAYFIFISFVLLGFAFSVGGLIGTHFKSRAFFISTFVFAAAAFLSYQYVVEQFDAGL